MGLDKVIQQMDDCRYDKQSFDDIEALKINVGGNRGKIGYDFDEAGQGYVEGVRLLWV